MRFWSIKYAEKPNDNEQDGYDESRERYEEGDNFNNKGLLIYYTMKMRQPYRKHLGLSDEEV